MSRDIIVSMAKNTTSESMDLIILKKIWNSNQCITLKVQHHQAWSDLCISVKIWSLLRIVTIEHMRQIDKFSNVATISWNISFICSSSYGVSGVVILVILVMQDATEKFISDQCLHWGLKCIMHWFVWCKIHIF